MGLGNIERVAVFIDNSNLYKGLKSNYGNVKIDYYKFGQELTGEERQLMRIYFYTSPYPREINEEIYKNQQRFLSKVKQTPYVEVKLGRLVKRDSTIVEKGVDIFMAVDMLKYAYSNNYDTAIVVTGDGDFAEAVQAVKDVGKHVEHAYFRDSSDALKDASDKFILLERELLDKCLL